MKRIKFEEKHYLLINMMYRGGRNGKLTIEYIRLVKLYMKAIKHNKESYWV